MKPKFVFLTAALLAVAAAPRAGENWPQFRGPTGQGVADATGLPAFPFEVSPLFGDDEASFASSWAARGQTVPPAPGLLSTTIG